MRKKFSEFIDSKTTRFNHSATPMDHEIRLHKYGAVQIRFKKDPVAMAKSGEIVLTVASQRESS